MSNTDKQQLINNLREIQDLVDKTEANSAERDRIEKEAEDIKDELAKTWVDAAKKFDNEERTKLPSKPSPLAGWSHEIPSPLLINWKKPLHTIILTSFAQLFKIIGIPLSIALLFLAGLISAASSFVGSLFTTILYLTLASFGFGCYYLTSETNKENLKKCIRLSKLEKEKEKFRDWETKFDSTVTNEAIDKFYKEFINYDKAFLSYTKKLEEKAEEISMAYEKECSEKTQSHLDKTIALHEENIAIFEQLLTSPILHKDYVFRAGDLANLLASGRADTLKEAINLMLDEDRKDSQEAERRAETFRREEEMHRHNAAMQSIAEQEARDARAHNIAMEKAANEQAMAMKKQAEIAEKTARDADARMRRQESDARSEASRRCNVCANKGKCSTVGMVNCPAYRPR